MGNAMANSVAERRGNATGNPFAPALPLIGMVPPAAPAPSVPAAHGWLCRIADESIAATIGRAEACDRLQMSASVLSRHLAMQDGKCLNLARLGDLGDDVVIDFVDRVRAHLGADDPSTRLQRAMQLIAQGVAVIVGEVKR